jgi:hypothetical protein
MYQEHREIDVKILLYKGLRLLKTRNCLSPVRRKGISGTLKVLAPLISFPLNFGINDPPLPPLIRGVGGIEFVAGIFLIDISEVEKR